MRPLLLTNEVHAAVERVVLYAKEHVISWPEIQARATGAIKGSIGDDPNRYVEIPIGYRCAFSMHMQKWIRCRQLSISVDTRGKYPNEHAVHEIAKLFGFTDGVKGPNITTWIEEEVQAINVLEAFA